MEYNENRRECNYDKDDDNDQWQMMTTMMILLQWQSKTMYVSEYKFEGQIYYA